MTDKNKKGFTRRGFLKSSAVSSAVILGGGTGAAFAGRAKPETVVAPDPMRAAKLTEKKKVIVVGGGLAGLSSAVELAERGFEVELFEASTHCGGRVGGWESTVLGERMTHEHGFHGFFYQYYNLRELIQRTCDPADYLAADAYPVAIKGKDIDVLYANKAPFPFNMLNVVTESSNLDLMPLATASPAHIIDMLQFDPIKTFEKLDGTDFKSWCLNSGIAMDLYDFFYDPYVRTMFVRPEEVSAAEMIQMFHSYFVANPEGMGMEILRRPSLDSLINPLTDYFKSLGGTLHVSAPIEGLVEENGLVKGVVRKVKGDSKRLADIPMSEIPEQGYQMVASSEGPLFIGKWGQEEGEASELKAFSARCSHQGCPVQWHQDKGNFICPCHQGRYNDAGQPIGGPPKEALTSLQTQEDSEQVVISTNHNTRMELIEADYVVLATDVKAVRNIVAGSQWQSGKKVWHEHIAALTTCRPYSVARHWLDKPVDENRHPLYTIGGYHPVDEIFLFSQFQEDSIDWAKRKGGTVMETHCYALDYDVRDADEIHDHAMDQVVKVLPELDGVKTLHREVQLLDNFSGYGVGDFAKRPPTMTPYKNLMLAGDYVRIDLPLELMERATVSGRMAANEILNNHNVRQVKIVTPPVRGILA